MKEIGRRRARWEQKMSERLSENRRMPEYRPKKGEKKEKEEGKREEERSRAADDDSMLT